MYSGDHGPGYWDETAGWEACAGTAADARQSPVNIRRARADRSLEPLNLSLFGTEIHLINNGHVIEQEYHPGSTLALDGALFDLLQFHFHTFSEHTVRGKRGAMEMHAVFKDAVSGNLAVIGTIYRIGRSDDFLGELLGAGLPEKSGDTVSSHHEINLTDGLTSTASYYTYPGSLTTPPCSEIVTWIVLKDQATMSRDQFQSFRQILGNDFRPLQDLNGRVVRVTADSDDDDD